jgi:ribosome maturation factor RimP
MPESKNAEQAIEKVTEATETIVKSFGFELVEVRFGQNGRQKLIEVTIYNPCGAVGLEDCEKVSREVDAKLDEMADVVAFFHGPFVLDVASPGIDRVLKSEREFKIFCGRRIEVKTKVMVGADPYGQHFTAKLAGFKDAQLHLSELGPVQSAPIKSKNSKKHAANKVSQEPVKELVVPLKNITQIRLYPDLQKKLRELEQEQEQELTQDQDLNSDRPNEIEVLELNQNREVERD